MDMDENARNNRLKPVSLETLDDPTDATLCAGCLLARLLPRAGRSRFRSQRRWSTSEGTTRSDDEGSNHPQTINFQLGSFPCNRSLNIEDTCLWPQMKVILLGADHQNQER